MTDSLTIHHTAEPQADISVPDSHQDHYSKTILGFWIYLMTDCILFATLFITYAVLHNNTFGGITSHELYRLPIAFLQTMVLLTSSATCGLSLLAAKKNNYKQTNIWLFVTLLLGITFLFLEIREFQHHLDGGHSWKVSAFLSSYFGLVGTHGLHIAAGTLWGIVMVGQLYFQGLVVDTYRRLMVFGLFWHFLELIWIFVFTFVYLAGVI